jgi:hypothetical protein
MAGRGGKLPLAGKWGEPPKCSAGSKFGACPFNRKQTFVLCGSVRSEQARELKGALMERLGGPEKRCSAGHFGSGRERDPASNKAAQGRAPANSC